MYIPTASQRISEINAEWESENLNLCVVSERVPNSHTFRYKIAPRNMAEKRKSGGGWSWKLI
jgi:hypothetical protein